MIMEPPTVVALSEFKNLKKKLHIHSMMNVYNQQSNLFKKKMNQTINIQYRYILLLSDNPVIILIIIIYIKHTHTNTSKHDPSSSAKNVSNQKQLNKNCFLI